MEMKPLPTLVILGGGEAFDNDSEYLATIQSWGVRFFEDRTSWKTTLYRELSDRFRVLIPELPCKQNAKYDEWELFFEKFAPELDPETTTYVGHSLGAVFLAKYFSENPIRAKALHLVAAPFDKCGTFELGANLPNMTKNVPDIHFWHSEDDPVVDFGDLSKYLSAFPGATAHVFKDRLHFNQERFDELA